MDADLLIVAHQGDELAKSFMDIAVSSGRRPTILEHEEAGRAFSIFVNGRGDRVQPVISTFLRPPIHRPCDDRDEAFLLQESHATLWAAMVLTRAAVIGRPTRWGP